jgi:hypothetical protein
LKFFTVDGKTYSDLEIITVDGKDYYLVKVALPAAEAARDIVLAATLTVGAEDYSGTWTMSIPKYAEKVIATGTATEATLVRDVLSYIRAAYAYFGTDDAEAIAAIDSILGEGYDANNAPKLDGSAEAPTEGLSAVTFVLGATPAIRFYITGNAESYAFYVGGSKLKTVTESDENGTYVEMDVYAYAVCETITYTINGIEAGSYHINSYYTFVTTDEAYKNNADLINLVARFAKYCESAADYRDSVVGN